MFDYQLFLGLPLSKEYQQELAALPSSLREVFIQNQDLSYLQKIEYEGIMYLGKYIGSSIEVASLEAIQAHIYSLVKRLIPHEEGETSLLLLALPIPVA
jgi:hypothetical protein